MNENYLEHHGILGQKWGVRRGTSYPLDKSQYSALQRKLNGVKSSEARGAAKAQKAAAKALAKKQKAEKEAARKTENNQREKDKLVKSRNIKKILKNADKFTDDEIKAITARFQLEKNLRNVDDTFVTKGKKAIERMEVASGILNKTASIAENGTKTYNNVAKILNSMTDSDLPIIGEKKNAGPKVTTDTTFEKTDGFVTKKSTVTTDANGNKVTYNENYKTASEKAKAARDERSDARKEREDIRKDTMSAYNYKKWTEKVKNEERQKFLDEEAKKRDYEVEKRKRSYTTALVPYRG